MRTFLLLLILAAGGCAAPTQARAGTAGSQTLSLRAGWNAVFLEVQPAAAHPSELFAGLPVETVACFVPGRLDSQYLRSPGDAPWRDEGWVVWHAPERPDAFLSTLHEIQARRGLLIRASADFTWTVTGEVRATVLEWHPNTCSLTGLPVDPAAPPTFARFFEGSPAHRRLRIFRLESGNWKLVRNPAEEKVRSAEAYWIQTEGASTYQGPLRLELPRTGELDFGLILGSRNLGFVNEIGGAPARVSVEVMSADGAATLPLRRVQRNPATLATAATDLPAASSLPALAAGERTSIRLEPHRDAMKGTQASSLLRITDGRGTRLWVPVRARRETALPVDSSASR
jgi:hypothetical protein